MNLNKMSSAAGSSKDPIGVGPKMVRIVHIIDFGIQNRDPFQGEEKPPCNVVYIGFEFSTERTEYNGEDRPRWHGKQYNVFGGRGFENSTLNKEIVCNLDPDLTKTKELTQFQNLLGEPCMVIIGRTKTGKAKITGVTVAPGEVGPLENPPLYFDFQNPDKDVFDRLLDWQKTKIKEALNYGDIQPIVEGKVTNPKVEGKVESSFDDDDIPF